MKSFILFALFILTGGTLLSQQVERDQVILEIGTGTW